MISVQLLFHIQSAVTAFFPPTGIMYRTFESHSKRNKLSLHPLIPWNGVYLSISVTNLSSNDEEEKEINFGQNDRADQFSNSSN